MFEPESARKIMAGGPSGIVRTSRPGTRAGIALGLITSLIGAAQLLATPTARSADQRIHIIYLHGAIVEERGPTGRHPKYGAMDWPGIVSALAAAGDRVIADQRPPGTDPSAYADKVMRDVERLLSEGVPASAITIVGASKGAVIASLVSTRLGQDDVRYVLMGNCNPWLIRTFDPRLTGRILSIYDASDEIGGTCAPLVERSPLVSRFKEIRLETGLAHGFLYRPLREWINPVLDWASH